MKKMVRIFTVALMVSMFATGIAYADDAVLIPITAEQAFDAYANQEDPLSGDPANIAIVDVRTTAEYYWVGTCAQVDKIIKMNEDEIIPDNGKVILKANSSDLELEFDVDGDPTTLNVEDVNRIETSPIARLIPYKTWKDKKCEPALNKKFAKDIEALASEGIEVIIMMCRSGKRTCVCSECFDAGLFDAVYEIDQPDGENGRGGFQGTSYGNAYNGFRGFPGRKTSFQEYESVSWSDAGLPI
ncbi:MAG: hypothetical protein GAS50_05905, partial [Desulfobacterales bacterium]|nr:hypothetical protein [Desulfobacterales bacterium]